jgi:putative peptidoglycan lipid II flippase
MLTCVLCCANRNGNAPPDPIPALTLADVNLLKAASTVSLMTLASRVTGLIRELLMASAFGASAMTDAFNVAFRIPNLLRRLFAEGAFSQAFVPVLAATRSREGEAATRILVNQVATVLFWALTLTCLLGVLGAPVLVWAMASGLKEHGGGHDAAVFMTRWMFPYIGFMSLVALSAGILNTYKRFVVPAATPVLLNVAMIFAAWHGAPWFGAMGVEPIYAMAAGVMVGGALQLGIQVPVLYKLGLLPRVGWRWKDFRQAITHEGTRNILKLMLPALLGVSVAQVSMLINTQIASHLGTGSVSWLSYADRLMEFPTAMLGVALGVVLTPQLSAAKANGQDDRYAAMIDWGLRLVVVLAVPCAVALLTFAEPLVATLFHYGAFSARDVSKTAPALMGYGAGLVGLVAIKILAPAYYAKQDTRTPMWIAVSVLVCTQLLNLALVPWLHSRGLGHAGLALSIGLASWLNAGLLLAGLLRRGDYRACEGWGRFILQVTAASAVLAVFLLWASGATDWLAMKSQPWHRIGWMCACVTLAAALYFLSCAVAGMHLRRLVRPDFKS